MAVFFDFKIKPKEDCISYTQVTWHKSLPLLAVASHNEKSNVDQIDLHLDEGEDLRQSVVTKPSSINTLCWHPTRKILSSGWLNGEISNWNEHDGECNEGPIIHKSSITCLQWNGTGSRLISTDESGLLCVWKVDQRGRMQQAPLFKHAVNSPIKCLVFKLMIAADLAADIAAAAKAAVSGDETALDLFEWQKPGQSKFSIAQADSIQLFFGLKDGNVKFLDERGKCSDCFQVESAVKYLVYYQDKDIVITITEALLLTQHTISKNNEYTETHKVKLSGQAINFCIAWAGNGLLATSCKERVARVLDVDNDQNFVLNLDGNSSFTADECITSISYSQQKGMLAGGTNKGHVAMWKYNAIREEPWELQASSDVQGVVDNLEWGTSQSLLAVNSKTSITILSQSVMNSCFNDKTAAIQMSPNQLSVETFPAGQVYDIKTDVHIKGVSCTKNHTVIWNGKKVAVYEVLESKAMVRASGTFNSDSHMIGVYEQNIYMLETDKITVRTFQGTVKQELSFLEQEGEPSDICVFGIHLCIGTNKGVLKVYDLSRREARQVGTTKYLDEAIPGFTCFECVKCNCNGSKIAFTIKTGTHVMSSYLYVWDVESDTIQCFNFELGKSSQELDDELAATQAQLTSSLKGYSPISVHWDPADPKLLACEVTKVSNNKKSFTSINQNKTTAPTESSETLGEGLVVVSMFSTPGVGLIVQDFFLVDQSVYSVLLGIDMPHFYFVKSNKNAENMTKKSHVIRKTFRDFIGLEDADASVLKAMSDFSYLSAVGNMDEAFKAIKTIKSGSVWENMARMCVKTKRLDVAMVCLGNMGNPGAAKAVRECQKQEPELNAHIAMLAIQIGMNDEAEKLYKECKRYDLLNQFYQASDNWKQAIECAESHDRIHLRTTYYNYGKYLESYGNIPNAILQYERSDTHKFEVPRMLFEQQEKLEAYITKQKDSNLYKWWAQYNESIGEMDTALHYYELSKEYLSMVRVLCYCNNLERASQLCNDIGDKAACYHLARQYESNSDAKNAIHYFSRAHSYSNAIRLAKESEMDNELVSLALLSTQENMLDCARYFEMKEDMADKAVLLYHKGGSVSKAIDLAFKTQQFGALQLISEDLDENADPEILRQCAEFFIQHDQYDRAVNLLVVAKRFDEALTMCEDHHIDLTEELAEKMTPSKDDSMGSNERNGLLEKIGECAYRQGSLHLATKKFTQAGNRVKAMKALLKSGDTEKIIFFAGVSRQREIYVMAANYLQSLDWRRDPEIMKNIISFYTKGRSLESLSSFYDACAQVEIDEFQNYEKAFGALSESYKCLSKSKSKNSGQHEERLALIKTRLTQMKAYIQAKKSYEINPDESIQECLQLLTEPDLSSSVRVGDVYGFVVQHYFAAQNHDQAYQIIEDMRSRYPKLKLRNYISVKIIEQVHKQVGVPYHGDQQRNGISNGQMESDGEDLDEEIEENDTDDYI